MAKLTARAYLPQGSLLLAAVDELLNRPNPSPMIHPLPPGRGTVKIHLLPLGDPNI